MLIPLVWFEESALIPEESARKFKSLYTDRIRMVNIVLTTLFLAALALLAIDMRLLVNHYTSCFNMKISCKIASSSSSTSTSTSTSSSSSALNNSKSSSNLTNSLSSKATSETDNSRYPLYGKKKRNKNSNLRADLTKTLPVRAVAAAMLKSSSQNYHHHKSLAEQEEANYLKRTRLSSNGQSNLPLLSNSNGNNRCNSTPATANSNTTTSTNPSTTTDLSRT